MLPFTWNAARYPARYSLRALADIIAKVRGRCSAACCCGVNSCWFLIGCFLVSVCCLHFSTISVSSDRIAGKDRFHVPWNGGTWNLSLCATILCAMEWWHTGFSVAFTPPCNHFPLKHGLLDPPTSLSTFYCSPCSCCQ